MPIATLPPPSSPYLSGDDAPFAGDLQDGLLAQAEEIARSTFGFGGLRPHQREVLSQILSGKDCLAVLPTGSGKSLCYALPALLRPGLVLVISPLIALIRDQVRKLNELGVPCAALDSLQTAEEKEQVFQGLASRSIRLLIVSPERLARIDFREKLREQTLQLIAIDEAHCISQWGNHFRPDYRFLGDYLESFGSVQKLAVTATATRRVREDIGSCLRLMNPAAVMASFVRDNLRFKVVKASKVAQQLTAVLQGVLAQDGSGIVYTPTRKSAREVHKILFDAGVAVELYHGGLTAELRRKAQADFMSGEARVMVATHAFGMGIDKADIRFVFHAGLPASLEQYVQEVGRAGRDGRPASCTLVYGPRDFYIQKFILDKSFPDADRLKSILRHTRALVAGSPGRSEIAILQDLAAVIDMNSDDLRQALDVLCREGLLVRLKDVGAGYSSNNSGEVLLADGSAGLEAAFFESYPLRKGESLIKLDAMRNYASMEGERSHFLDEYFRD